MISTIVLDFAGVMTTGNFFPLLAKRLGEKFGVDPLQTEKNLYAHEGPYLIGQATTEEFWRQCFPGSEVSLDDFKREFGSAYELEPRMLGLVKKLKKNYQMVLHTDNFEALSSAIRNDPRLNQLFEKMLFSNEMHLTKQDEGSFRRVLSEIGKEPGECVFADDKEKNLRVPAGLGMRTILFQGPEYFAAELEKIGVTV